MISFQPWQVLLPILTACALAIVSGIVWGVAATPDSRGDASGRDDIAGPLSD